jgi:hypothetical protein
MQYPTIIKTRTGKAKAQAQARDKKYPLFTHHTPKNQPLCVKL